MGCKELRHAGVLARVKSGELKLGNAAVMMGLSYRQTKRLAKRYREEGAKGLKHGSAAREGPSFPDPARVRSEHAHTENSRSPSMHLYIGAIKHANRCAAEKLERPFHISSQDVQCACNASLPGSGQAVSVSSANQDGTGS